MNDHKQNNADNCKVTFLPIEKELIEIKNWLIEEEQNTGNGFYCNWKSIKSSFEKHELATISLNHKTIGFATWQLTTNKTARIVIAEIEPSYRNSELGKTLMMGVFDSLKDKGFYVVDLLCVLKESEPFWKSIGFQDFPESPEKYNFNFDGSKRLYKILKENLQPNSKRDNDETIELWNDEPCMINESKVPTNIWYPEFLDGSRKLSKPIIFPANDNWRLRWGKNGKKIDDDRVRKFKTGMYFGSFLIIEELSISG